MYGIYCVFSCRRKRKRRDAIGAVVAFIRLFVQPRHLGLNVEAFVSYRGSRFEVVCCFVAASSRQSSQLALFLFTFFIYLLFTDSCVYGRGVDYRHVMLERLVDDFPPPERNFSFHLSILATYINFHPTYAGERLVIGLRVFELRLHTDVWPIALAVPCPYYV